MRYALVKSQILTLITLLPYVIQAQDNTILLKQKLRSLETYEVATFYLVQRVILLQSLIHTVVYNCGMQIQVNTNTHL